MANAKRRIRPSTIFLIIVLLFLIPLFTAWVMFKGHHFFGLMNHGQLVKPPFPVSLLKLKDERGEIFDKRVVNSKKKAKPQQRTHGKWILVYFNPGLCEQTCQKGLFNLRQIRKATGENMRRVGRALLRYPSNLANDTSINLIISERFPGTRHLVTKEENFADVVRQHVRARYALKPGTIYLIDPLGNVMMTYKPGTDPDDIYKDLKRLLKVSQVG